jgi:hypothetical protein
MFTICSGSPRNWRSRLSGVTVLHRVSMWREIGSHLRRAGMFPAGKASVVVRVRGAGSGGSANAVDGLNVAREVSSQFPEVE